MEVVSHASRTKDKNKTTTNTNTGNLNNLETGTYMTDTLTKNYGGQHWTFSGKPMEDIG